MKLPRIIYLICLGIFGGMMGACGYSVTSWQFWLGVALIITAHFCGEAYKP